MTPHALLLASALAVLAASAHAQVVVKMDAPTQARLGLRTAPLAAGRGGATAGGFARGLDLTPLATLDADLTASAAAARASAAEAARSGALAQADATVSRKAAEAAAAQARSDAARVTLLRRRVGLEWGAGLAAMSDAQRSGLIAAAARGRAALVRIDRLGGAPVSAAVSAELDLGAHGKARARLLGPARAGDPRTTSVGVLARVDGPAAAWIGAGVAFPATFPAPPGAAQGVLIPREALLRTAGATYAYVRRDAGGFERRPVSYGSPQPDGLFVAFGFRPGEPVVVSGAAKLFAAEKTPAKGE